MKTLDRSGLLVQASEGFAFDTDCLPPINVAAPELLGPCEIGTRVSARPGVWAGASSPEIQTTLTVDGVARRFPFMLTPEHDGREVLVSDVASNEAGSARVTSARVLVRYPAPQATGIPEDVPIGGGMASVDMATFFSGASGGMWSVSCEGGPDLQCDIDAAGRVTIGGGLPSGSATVSVTYANSGGSSTTNFSVLSDTVGIGAPGYDGTLAAATAFVGDGFELQAGAAFTGEGLVFESAGLPAGLEIDAASGRISGTLGSIGDYTVTVTATNSGGTASGTFPLGVSARPLVAPAHTGPLGDIEAHVGDPVLVETAAAFTGEGLTFTAAGYPAELEMDVASGRISGTLATVGHFTVTVTASNSSGEATGSFALSVAEKVLEAPSYTGGLSGLAAQVGDSVSIDTAAAFTGESLVFASAGLPAGLEIDAASGQISGTLGSSGDYTVTVTASNSGGTASGSFALTVAEPPVAAPVYDGALEAQQATVGKPFGYLAGGAFTGESLSFAATGLAPGLAIDPVTGGITGTPTADGAFTVDVTASNPGGAATGSFQIAVAAVSVPPVEPPPTVASATAFTVESALVDNIQRLVVVPTSVTPTAVRYTTRPNPYTYDPVANFANGTGVEPCIDDETEGWVTSWYDEEGASTPKPSWYEAELPPGQEAVRSIGVWFLVDGQWIAGDGTGNATLPTPEPTTLPPTTPPPTATGDFTFGAQTHASQTGWKNEYVTQARDEIGFDAMRDGCRTSSVGTASSGSLSFTDSRTLHYQNYPAAGIGMAIVCHFGWQGVDGGNIPYTNAGRIAFADQYRKVIDRAVASDPNGNLPVLFEVANEVNGLNSVFFNGPILAASKADRAPYYRQIMETVYNRNRGSLPDRVKIIGPGIHSHDLTWLKLVYPNGPDGYCDGIPVHPYGSTPEPHHVDQHNKHLHAWAQKPLHMTEQGIETGARQFSPEYNFIMTTLFAADPNVHSVFIYAMPYQSSFNGMELYTAAGALNDTGKAMQAYHTYCHNVANRPADISPDNRTRAFVYGNQTLVVWGHPRVVTVPSGSVWRSHTGAQLSTSTTRTISKGQPLICQLGAAYNGSNITFASSQIVAHSYWDYDLGHLNYPSLLDYRSSAGNVLGVIDGGGPGRPWIPVRSTGSGSHWILAESLIDGSSAGCRVRFTAAQSGTYAYTAFLDPKGTGTMTAFEKGSQVAQTSGSTTLNRNISGLSLNAGQTIELMFRKGDNSRCGYQLVVSKTG